MKTCRLETKWDAKSAKGTIVCLVATGSTVCNELRHTLPVFELTPQRMAAELRAFAEKLEKEA